ncbi:Apoptosis inhibitor 5-like protein [Drosera capensis]
MKKLTPGINDHKKAMANTASDEAKERIKTQKKNATTGLRTCNNILAMTQPLHARSPSFISDKRISLSWKEPTNSSEPSSGYARASLFALDVYELLLYCQGSFQL